MKLTREQIFKGQSGNGGWNSQQFVILGISWPPKSGWMWDIQMKEITPDQYQRFLQLKGSKKKRKEDFRKSQLPLI